MEVSKGPPPLPRIPSPPNPEIIKRNLLNKGVTPTPKIIHTLRKKHLQKSTRKFNRQSQLHPPLTPSQNLELDEEAQFQILKSEFKAFTKAIDKKTKDKGDDVPFIGKPWESLERGHLRQLANGSGEFCGESLKTEHLRELGDIIESERQKLQWLFLDDDVELEDGWIEKKEGQEWTWPKSRTDAEAIKFLVDRLSGTEMGVKDWKFCKMMKNSGLTFTEGQMLKLVGRLGEKGEWKHALSVVEWVYNPKECIHLKSRFVYTKLLAVLGKAGRPREALRIFNKMLGDWHIYPDMPAYHSIAVALGQAGLLKDLIKVIELMKQQPSRNRKNVRRKNWTPMLEADLVVFNAVLNACVPSRQWKGVSWVFEQLRKSGLKPNGATYGLAMEEMLLKGNDAVWEV